VFTRNRYHLTAPAIKQGSTTLALVLGHSCNQVPVVGWTPDHHVHGNPGSTNHRTTAGQSSHILISGGPSNRAIMARSSFTFTALTKKGPSNPAITSIKDSHALAHTKISSSSAVSSTIGNIYLYAYAMEKHNGQVLTTARDLTTHVVTTGRLRNQALANSILLVARILLSSHQGSVVASSARTMDITSTEPRPVHEGATLPPQGKSSTMHSHQVPQGLLQDLIHKAGTRESCTQLQRGSYSMCRQSQTSPVMTLHTSFDSKGIQFNPVKPTVHLQAAITSRTIDTTHQPTDKLSPLQDQALSAEYHHLTIEKGRKANAERECEDSNLCGSQHSPEPTNIIKLQELHRASTTRPV